jgi:hypothetical protein
MALPTSRQRTYASSDPVLSADINVIQDCIISAKHGDITVEYPAGHGLADGSANAWDFVGLGYQAWWATPGASTLYVVFPVILPVGSRIRSFRAYVQDTTGGHTIGASLNQWDPVAVNGAVIATAANSAGNGAVQTLSQTGIDHTMVASRSYLIAVVNNSSTVTTHKILGASVTYDKP